MGFKFTEIGIFLNVFFKLSYCMEYGMEDSQNQNKEILI